MSGLQAFRTWRGDPDAVNLGRRVCLSLSCKGMGLLVPPVPPPAWEVWGGVAWPTTCLWERRGWSPSLIPGSQSHGSTGSDMSGSGDRGTNRTRGSGRALWEGSPPGHRLTVGRSM